MRFERGEDLVADRTIEGATHVLDRGEQEWQRRHRRQRLDGIERREVHAVEVEPAEGGDFQSVAFVAQLSAGIHAQREPAARRLFQHLAEPDDRLHCRIVVYVRVGCGQNSGPQSA